MSMFSINLRSLFTLSRLVIFINFETRAYFLVNPVSVVNFRVRSTSITELFPLSVLFHLHPSHLNPHLQVFFAYSSSYLERFGLIRANEFLMKDLYSFDADTESAMRTYDEVSFNTVEKTQSFGPCSRSGCDRTKGADEKEAELGPLW